MDPETTDITAGTEAGATSGDAAPAPTTEQAQEVPPAPSAPAPGLLDQARAMLADKASLLADNRRLRAENGSLQAALTPLQAEVADLRTQVTALTAERNEFARLVTEAAARDKRLAAAVTDELASLGVPAEQLPASANGPTKGDADDLMEQFKAATDPLEKATLARKLKTVQAHN